MSHYHWWRTARAVFVNGLCLASAAWAWTVRGDQVEMVNGDRYLGKVVSLDNETLVIQSEFLGALKIPRARISTIALGPTDSLRSTNAARLAVSLSRTNSSPRRPQLASTNANSAFDAALQQLGANSNIINQVQQQFLAGAGPEADAKFNDLVAGLMSGKLGVSDLRTEARTTLDRARSVQKEMGDDAGASLESYLSILEGFLKETELVVPPTNSPAATGFRASKPQKQPEDE